MKNNNSMPSGFFHGPLESWPTQSMERDSRRNKALVDQLIEADKEAAQIVAETGDETLTGSAYTEAERPMLLRSRPPAHTVLDSFFSDELPPGRKPMIQ